MRGDFRAAFDQGIAERARLRQDVALAGQLGNEDVLPVADLRRVHVLVAARQLLHRVDVDAALVRERRRADERRAGIVRAVGQFIDEKRQFGQPRQGRRDRQCPS